MTYIVVGWLAAVLHGSPVLTVDLDICPSHQGANLERLTAALAEMDAQLCTPDSDEGVRFPHDASFLNGLQPLILQTRCGRPTGP